jgi:hypothetical protein
MRTKVVLISSMVLALLLGGLAAYELKVSAKEAAPLEIPAGTPLHVRLNETLDTSRNLAGDPFSATLVSPVEVNGRVVVPKGIPVRGHLTAANPSGHLRGRGYMTVRLDSLDLNGKSYPIATSSQSRATASHKKRNWLWIGGGSGFGALVGGLAGGAKGALIGGGAGAAAGTATAALTGKKQVRLPAETALTFRLAKPVWIPASSAAPAKDNGVGV